MKSNRRPVPGFVILALALTTAFAACAAPIVWTATNGAYNNTNWSTATNWLGGATPTSSDAAEFFDRGNTTASNINNVVDTSFSVNALWYGQTNGSHTTLINPGQTLTAAGFTVGTETDNGGSQSVFDTVTGPGGTLSMNNTSSNLAVRQGVVSVGSTSSLRATLDLSGLDAFNANMARMLLGAGSVGSEARLCGTLYLARTNNITLTGTSPAILLGDGGDGTGTSHNAGNGSLLFLGETNVILANSITTGEFKQGNCQIAFDPYFVTNGLNPVAYFRGANGTGPVTNWAIADQNNVGGTVNTTGTNDFTGGKVDILASNIVVARTTLSTGTGDARGTFTFNAGTVNTGYLQLGYQVTVTNIPAMTNYAVGVFNANGTGTLIATNSIELGHIMAGGTNAQTGILNVNGGTVDAALIFCGAGPSNIIAVSSGTLNVTNTLGTNGAAVANFGITNATLGLAAQSGGNPTAVVTNLSPGGTTNVINVLSVPILTGYPDTFHLIQYSGSLNGTFNAGLGTVPPFNPPTNYVGYITNNTANNSIDLVLTSGPALATALTWNGNLGPDWDLNNTANWLNGGLSATFNQGDFVTFDDTAAGTTSVNMDTAVGPDGMTVSNNFKTYTLTGNNITGTTSLIKNGTGTLILDNTSQNNFTGGIIISNGTLQVGNSGDLKGNLPATGAILNNGTLSFNEGLGISTGSAPVVSEIISGTGQITLGNASAVNLAGNNNFSGGVMVPSGCELEVANANALGSTNGGTTIASGATLDFGHTGATNMAFAPETVTVSGSGASGVTYTGAIINSGTAPQENALQNVVLAGNTTLGGLGRWDIRGADINNPATASLSTSGNGYNLVKTGGNQISFTGVTVDPMLGNIDIQQGLLSVEEATTGLGNPSGTVTVEQGATLQLYSLTNQLNKNIVLNGNGTATNLNNGNGANTIVGAIGINSSGGSAVINTGGTSLSLNGSISDSGGSGSITKVGTNTLIIGGTATYSGGTTVKTGTFAVNGSLGGAGTLSVQTGAILTGAGTISSPVDAANGLINPGTVGGVGTLTVSGPLTLENTAPLTFDFTSGGNDVLDASGGLTLNGSDTITINFPQPQIPVADGIYRLINYSGTVGGSGLPGLNTAIISTPASRYGLTLNTATGGQVNVTITGAPFNLKWDSTSILNWDVAESYNFFDPIGATNTAFYQGDSVLFDDSVAGVLTNISITTNLVVFPSAITNNSSVNNFTISGPGQIGGTNRIVKLGTSTLTLASSNTFSGPVSVQAGTLRLGSTNALGSTNGTLAIAAGGTLELNNFAIGGEPTFVAGAGAGAGGNGAIINSSTNVGGQQNAFQFITLTADTTFGGANRWDLRAIGGTTGNPSTASLGAGGSGYNLTKAGTNLIGIVSATVDPTLGNVTISGGTLDFEGNTTSLGDPTKTVTIQSNAALFFFNATNHLNKNIQLNGGGTITNDSGTNFVAGLVTLSGTNCNFVIGGSSLTMSGAIGGSGTLVKSGPDNLVLAAANGYSGGTLVNSGSLVLSGTATIANSPTIIIASGATLDATGRGDLTLTLASGQTLYGTGTNKGNLVVGPGATVSPGPGSNVVGTLTVAGSVTLNGTTRMTINKGVGTNLLKCTSGTLTCGGILVVTNISANAYAAGDSFKLFSAPAFGATSFTSIIPAAPPGGGLAWDTSVLSSTGVLKVKTSALPVIGAYSVSGTTLTLGGSNAPAGQGFRVLMSTNVAALVATWQQVGSGTVNGDGTFNFSGAVATNKSAFYLIATP
jgi:fibronectin-binding autotransporter adhesin